MRVRIRLDLAYDGSEFAGWARQPGQRTVEGCLEDALTAVLASPPLALTCAGRTDAGVHATGQVAHVDVPADGLAGSLALRLNAVLPADVRVRGCVEAAAGFDARFSALWRRYRYRVSDRPGAADPLRRGYVLSWRRPVDVERMNEAAGALLGDHDFAAFCRPRPGATSMRQLQQLHWRRDHDDLAVLTAQADAFCHHMVRSLAGALLVVGEGRRPVGWPAELLRAARRDGAVPVVAAHGLTLEAVGYPPAAQLTERAEQTRRRRVPLS